MTKEKYKQLFLSLRFGGIRTITIHIRCVSCKKNYSITNDKQKK